MEAQLADQVDIPPFIAAADVIRLARHAGGRHPLEGAAVVLHVQPIADIFALAVNRDRVPAQGFQDDHRDEFFGKLERAVVVRTVGDQHRQAIGIAPSPRQMIARRLARGVGRVRVVGGGFGEIAGCAERTVHLVGGNMHEPERRPRRRLQPLPIAERGLQQHPGAHHIGPDELQRPVNRTVHMALRRQMQHGVRPKPREGRPHRRLIGDVRLEKFIAGSVQQIRHRLRIAGVGEGVHIEHPLAGKDQLADKIGADKAGAAGDQKCAGG